MASFSDYQAPELHQCAKHFKIKGHSKLKKGELVDLLNSRLKIMKSGEVKPRGSAGTLTKPPLQKTSHTSPVKIPKPKKPATPVGGQLPGSVLDKIKDLYLELRGAGLLSGGDADRSNTDQGDDPSLTDQIVQKGADKVGAIAVKKGDQQVGDAGLSFKDFVDSIEEDPDRANPNFVVNPTSSQFVDAINKLPVLKGPAKQLVEKVGSKVDKIVSKPLEAALDTAGVPGNTKDLIVSFAKPFEQTEAALKLLKITGRQGAVHSGPREQYMGAILKKAGVFGDDGKMAPGMTYDKEKKIADAAMLSYDVQNPASDQTKYAFTHDKPPYDRNPEYKKIMTDVYEIQLAAQKAAEKREAEASEKRVKKKGPLGEFYIPRGTGAEDKDVDWDDISWGSFTAQLDRYNSQMGKKMTLPQFAEMILKDPKKFQQKTVKRARFYKNVLQKK